MKAEKHLSPDEINLISLAQNYADEDKARSLLESFRWPNGPVCPHCKNDGKEKPNSKLTAKPDSKRGVRVGVYFCGACRKQFTVKVGTIFEDSHIPISKWLMAIFILCSAKKSISAHQMHRMLGVSYKTSWFMCHRIRHALAADSNTPKLAGTTEIDETYVGGVGDMKTKLKRKTPVIALVQRDGPMRTAVPVCVSHKNLKTIINECVDKSATLNTDQSTIYKMGFKDYARHDVVNHSKFEYTRRNQDGTVSGVNHCESFFSLLKRGVVGAWHNVSREHLHRYASEFEFRWNHRKGTDGERMVAAVGKTEGKRLTYRQVI